jgi:hypothetical protein
MKTLTLDESLVDHLQRILEQAIEHGENHISWLVANPNEPDHETQLRDTERSIELNNTLLTKLASES